MYSLLISTYNNINYLKLSIKSFRKNAFYNNIPIIIVAENCSDGTDEWLKNNHKKYNINYEIQKNEEPIGIGGGMNRCAELAETDYILFSHSDMYHTKDFDKSLIDTIKKEGRKHVVSSYRVEPKIFEYGQETKNGTVVVPKDKFGAYYDNFNEELFNEWADEFTRSNKRIDIPMAQGVSFMIHKEDWEDVGGNDPRFAPASHEDVDLFIRMRELDFEFHTIGSSLVYHFGARGSHFPDDDFSESSQRQKESERKNQKKFREKWGEGFTKDKYGMFILRSRL